LSNGGLLQMKTTQLSFIYTSRIAQIKMRIGISSAE